MFSPFKDQLERYYSFNWSYQLNQTVVIDFKFRHFQKMKFLLLSIDFYIFYFSKLKDLKL